VSIGIQTDFPNQFGVILMMLLREGSQQPLPWAIMAALYSCGDTICQPPVMGKSLQNCKVYASWLETEKNLVCIFMLLFVDFKSIVKFVQKSKFLFLISQMKL